MSSLSQFVDSFQSINKVPVDLEDVVGQLQDVTGASISVWRKPIKVEVCPGWFRGLIHSETGVVYGRVYYSSRLSLAEQRHVVCKELLHVLDPVEARADTDEKIRDLVAFAVKLEIPPKEIDKLAPLLSDVSTVIDSARILLPDGYFLPIAEALRQGTVEFEKVAAAAEVPVHTVRHRFEALQRANGQDAAKD